MPVTLRNADILFNDGTTQSTAASTGAFTNLAYTGTLTGGTGEVNLGSGQLVKEASGNVGIGITPTSRLHVGGNILATGSVECGTQFRGLSTDSATAPSFSFAGDTNTGMFRVTSNQVALTTGGTARLTVTTAQFTGTLPWRGQNGTAAAPAISFSGDTDTGIFRPSANTLAFTKGGVEAMRITSAGALILVGSTAQKATGAFWSNPSDERLKDNIRDYGKGIAELMQVRVREWEYNGKGGTVEGTKGLGVVADEVMVVLPDTVANYEAKLNADDEEVTAIKEFDATEIIWLLVKTVQEQQAIIKSLKARLDAANL